MILDSLSFGIGMAIPQSRDEDCGMIGVTDLNDNLQPLASEMGVEVTMAIVWHFGGTRLYVPRVWRQDLDINVLGEEVAQKLCHLFGPERLEVSRQAFSTHGARRLARALRASGLPNSAIARKLGLSYRMVTEHLIGTKPVPRQKRLAAATRPDRA